MITTEMLVFAALTCRSANIYRDPREDWATYVEYRMGEERSTKDITLISFRCTHRSACVWNGLSGYVRHDVMMSNEERAIDLAMIATIIASAFIGSVVGEKLIRVSPGHGERALGKSLITGLDVPSCGNIEVNLARLRKLFEDGASVVAHRYKMLDVPPCKSLAYSAEYRVPRCGHQRELSFVFDGQRQVFEQLTSVAT